MAKLFIEDLDVSGKRVLVRVDFNVPLDESGAITNDKRIVASLPTITYLSGRGAKVILMSHLGRPKGERTSEFSLKPVAEDLKGRFPGKVSFVDDCVGDAVAAAVDGLNDGDILLLENVRFYKEETANGGGFAAKLASLGDIYVNDAFGSAHRAHASTEGVTRHIEQCAAGYLMKKELDYLGAAVGNPARPFVAILGGAKISGKIDVIANLLDKVDTLLIGGAMMFTFYKAQGKEIGKSLLEEDKVDLARETLEKAGDKMVLPVDTIVAETFSNDAPGTAVPVDAIPADTMGLDIGPETIALFTKKLEGAKTIVWNGPMGVFEFDNYAVGTNEIAKVLAACTKKGATTIVGGGDSASAAKKAGVAKQISHISTGGGASLELLEGKELPGVAALSEA
ncbi:MAG: phosphoglycerate kinase [Chitinivibrionales bacterium]|nr:phosphoglycerate kinase [Chitinivibrionales bacterium]MBD3396908.1 phosphoglycerate kinase [Chitinivibrionales bacterium]